VQLFSSFLSKSQLKTLQKYSKMRDIQKMCRICLSQGSRDIFESSNIANMLARDDLSRIAEKLRYVTMLKVSRINGKICGNQGENVNELFWARKIATCGKFSLSLWATFSFVLSLQSGEVRCASKFLWNPKENRREKTSTATFLSFYVRCFMGSAA
jgi:hypothetical protein